MKEEMRQKFIEIFGNNRVLFDEPMSQHTTFRTGRRICYAGKL